MNILLLYGGISGEHAVSCVSASYVYKELKALGHSVVAFYIDKQNNFHLQDDVADSVAAQKKNPAQMIYGAGSSATTALKVRVGGVEVPTESSSEIFIDFIFPMIHGTNGEDGSVQGLAQFYDVAYAGCDVVSSGIGMQKKIMKQVFAMAKLPQTRFMPLTFAEYEYDKNAAYEKIAVAVPFPLFVKPCNTGSSVGVHKIKSKEDFFTKVEDAFLYDSEIIIERGHDVVELEIAIAGTPHQYEVSVIGEIKPTHDFYSYEAKYLDPNGAQMQIPARLKSEQVQQIEEYARAAFAAIGGEGFARIDFFLDKHDGEIYINEINTLPGFTPVSMFPKLFAASGRPIGEILQKIIDIGLERKLRLNRLNERKLR